MATTNDGRSETSAEATADRSAGMSTQTNPDARAVDAPSAPSDQATHSDQAITASLKPSAAAVPRPVNFDGIGLGLLALVMASWEVMLSRGTRVGLAGRPLLARADVAAEQGAHVGAA